MRATSSNCQMDATTRIGDACRVISARGADSGDGVSAIGRIVDVVITIKNFVDEHQPGWVACIFVDVYGREWSFVEKVPIVTTEDLDAESTYPCAGAVTCQVLARHIDAAGREIVTIDMNDPWPGVEATSGETRFEVFAEQLRVADKGT